MMTLAEAFEEANRHTKSRSTQALALKRLATEVEKLDPDKNRQNWLDIGTAPKGERILLWSGTGMYCGHWAKSIETDDEAWIIAEFGNDGDQLLIKATHWMPLPPPPV